MRAQRVPMLVCLLMLVMVRGEEVKVLNGKKLETGGLSRNSFPKGFVFGTATSAYQVEGMADKDGRGPSIWDIFIQKPGIVANNGTGEVSVDQYHHYKGDIDLMQSLNFDAYRFSISWSRIFPEGVGKVNWKGVAYYNRLIDYMLKRVTYIKERYGNPTVILSENGMDDPGNLTFAKAVKDTTRINYYRSYIGELKKAIDDGANVVGYFAWSLLDNFEWRSGYTSRFGIVYVDYKTLKRYPKMSAYWFQSILSRAKN
ncbi:Glycoside hydrolase family 1 [Dillenia turbinata]|uniref:Glycoside hydrolase family 1 n=1 Tax=Dillenia turbinata TaxID=194707 RepID=A0AAN8V241_9MAGN